MKKIIIWGTGNGAKVASDNIKKYSQEYEICFYGENDTNKIGSKLNGISIVGIKELKDIRDIDFIVIASMYVDEIKETLIQNKVDIEIIDKWNLLCGMPYNIINIEVSGKCNANCRWCQTGKTNLNGMNNYGGFMTYDKFKEIYFYCRKENIIVDETVVELYNWGEPFLNPDFNKIIEFLNEQGTKFSLSTNGSIVRKFEGESTLKNLISLTISMPGFSQNSYDKMHGFNFEKIKKNIKEIVENFRSCGFIGNCYVSYHVYQFNKHELSSAKKFADEIGIDVFSYYAYFNGYDMTKSYLENTMDYNELMLSGKQLDLFYVDELIKHRPKYYNCPQYSRLVLNEQGNVLLCCGIDRDCKDYSWGNICDLSLKELYRIKQEAKICETCKRCSELGADYWGHNVKSYN